MGTVTELLDDLDRIATETFESDLVFEQAYFTANHLKIVHQNIRSTNRNFDEFLTAINGQSFLFDILILTETWHSERDGSTYSIPNYDSFFSPSKINKCDGVSIFVKSELAATFQINKFDSCNSASIQFKIGMKAFEIMAVYRPWPLTVDNFNSDMAVYLEKRTKSNSFILIGDMNIDLLNENPPVDTVNYITNLNSFGLKSLINKYTRVTTNSKTCLDHIFCSDQEKDVSGHILKTSITDHYMTALSFKLQTAQQTKTKTHTVQRINYNLIERLLLGENWETVLNEKNVNECTEIFLTTLQDYISKATVTKIIQKKFQKLKPWMTGGLLKSIRHRDKLRQHMLKNPKTENITNYKNYRNELKKLLELTKIQYYKQKISEAANNPKMTWQIMNEITNKPINKTTIKSIRDENGRIINNTKNMANSFNTHFTNIGQKLTSQFSKTYQQTTCNNNKSSLFFRPTDKIETLSYINELKTDSATGPDGISARILKQFKEILVTPITHIINLSLKQAIFPNICKIATVIPIHKKGDKSDMNNYRPISLTSNLGKLIEKTIKARITNFLEKFNFFAANQYGFRAGRNTQDAITHLTKLLHDDLDNGLRPICIYLDLQKAFDTVSHDILLNKLKAAGIRGQTHDLLASYLSDRKQQVQLYDEESSEVKSEFTTVTCGVPQGTVLGPILFLIYINELFQMNPDCTLLGFADDTVVYCSGRNWTEAYSKATQAILSVKQWLDKHRLTLNTSKTEYMTFSTTKTGQPTDDSLTLTIHKTCCVGTDPCTCDKLKHTDKYKYLGLTIDNHLKWNHHTQITASRIRRTIYKFRQLRNILNVHEIRKLYFAIVHSIAQYGILAWGGAYPVHLHPVEAALGAVIRVALQKPRRYPTSLLSDEFDVPSLITTYSLQLLTNIHKHRHNNHIIDHGKGTRLDTGHTLKIARPKTELYKHSHSYLSIKIYNLLPINYRQEANPKKFKALIRKFIELNRDKVLEILRPG